MRSYILPTYVNNVLTCKKYVQIQELSVTGSRA